MLFSAFGSWIAGVGLSIIVVGVFFYFSFSRDRVVKFSVYIANWNNGHLCQGQLCKGPLKRTKIHFTDFRYVFDFVILFVRKGLGLDWLIWWKFADEKEQEMQIGLPTDVKHVAHIGWDGPSGNQNNPGWVRTIKGWNLTLFWFYVVFLKFCERRFGFCGCWEIAQMNEFKSSPQDSGDLVNTSGELPSKGLLHLLLLLSENFNSFTHRKLRFKWHSSLWMCIRFFFGWIQPAKNIKLIV